jgi:hypothetical protein
VSVTEASTPPLHGPAIVTLEWDRFLEYMADCWEPGQHIAMIGPTGEGKTTVAVGLLGVRKYVFALDPKGEDTTLSASGYDRIKHVPNSRRLHDLWCTSCRRILRDIADGTDMRLIVGGAARTDAQDAKLHELMRAGITYARRAGGWTLYVDEFELLSSQRMFRLGSNIERMLITARKDGTSVVTSFQAAAWVSKHATRQARFAIMYATGDRDMIQAVAKAMGRDWRELEEAVDELPRFHILVIPRGKNGGPMILTTAPKVA